MSDNDQRTPSLSSDSEETDHVSPSPPPDAAEFPDEPVLAEEAGDEPRASGATHSSKANLPPLSLSGHTPPVEPSADPAPTEALTEEPSCAENEPATGLRHRVAKHKEAPETNATSTSCAPCSRLGRTESGTEFYVPETHDVVYYVLR